MLPPLVIILHPAPASCQGCLCPEPSQDVASLLYIYCSYSAGLRIYCADRKKTFSRQAKIPSPQVILHGFLPVTVRVLNSYDLLYHCFHIYRKKRKQIPEN